MSNGSSQFSQLPQVAAAFAQFMKHLATGVEPWAQSTDGNALKAAVDTPNFPRDYTGDLAQNDDARAAILRQISGIQNPQPPSGMPRPGAAGIAMGIGALLNALDKNHQQGGAFTQGFLQGNADRQARDFQSGVDATNQKRSALQADFDVLGVRGQRLGEAQERALYEQRQATLDKMGAQGSRPSAANEPSPGTDEKLSAERLELHRKLISDRYPGLPTHERAMLAQWATNRDMARYRLDRTDWMIRTSPGPVPFAEGNYRIQLQALLEATKSYNQRAQANIDSLGAQRNQLRQTLRNAKEGKARAALSSRLGAIQEQIDSLKSTMQPVSNLNLGGKGSSRPKVGHERPSAQAPPSTLQDRAVLQGEIRPWGAGSTFARAASSPKGAPAQFSSERSLALKAIQTAGGDAIRIKAIKDLFKKNTGQNL